MVCDKSGRREFEQLLWQFSRLRQTHTIAEYVTQFNTAMNCLIAHHKSWDPLYFVNKFVDGLHADIWVIVMVQQPKDLDFVVFLVVLQEEALELAKDAACPSSGTSTYSRPPRTVVPLPPPRTGRPLGVEDRQGAAVTSLPSTDDKVQASPFALPSGSPCMWFSRQPEQWPLWRWCTLLQPLLDW
jgi:hypothetical protein